MWMGKIMDSAIHAWAHCFRNKGQGGRLEGAQHPFQLTSCEWADVTPCHNVTVQPVTLARKVGPGLQDLQTRARRILAERNAEKAEENTWIGRMVAAENLNDMKALIKSRDSV